MTPYQKRKKRSRRMGIALVAGSAVIVTGLVTGLMLFQPAQRHAQTQCLLHQSPPAHTVVVIDQTDPRSLPTQAELKRQVVTLAGSLPENGRFTLLTFRGDAGMPHVTLDVCRVPSGRDANLLYQNPDMIEAQFRKHYAGPIHAAIEKVSAAGNAKTTNLIEALTHVTASFASSDGVTQLHVFSDFRENTKALSLYRRVPNQKAFRRYLEQKNAHRLARVSLHFHYTPITGRAPGTEPTLKTLWVTALSRMSIPVSWTRL